MEDNSAPGEEIGGGKWTTSGKVEKVGESAKVQGESRSNRVRNRKGGGHQKKKKKTKRRGGNTHGA